MNESPSKPRSQQRRQEFIRLWGRFLLVTAVAATLLMLGFENLVHDIDDLAEMRGLLRIQAAVEWLVIVLVVIVAFARRSRLSLLGRENPQLPMTERDEETAVDGANAGESSGRDAEAGDESAERNGEEGARASYSARGDDLLQANQELQERISRLRTEQQMLARGRDAILRATHEAILLMDASGAITGVSAEVAKLLHVSRDSLIGKRFEDVVPLFQDGTEFFRNYPLRNLVARVVTSGSTIPQTEDAIVLNQDNEPTPVTVTVSAVLETSGSSVAIGATVTIRVRTEDMIDSAPAAEGGDGAGAAAEEAEHDEHADWGRRLLGIEAFERRLVELAGEAGRNETPHSLVYARLDDLDHINDQLGFWAGEQALWHAAQTFAMAIADDGTGYRCTNSRYATLLIGYDEERAMKVAERVRELAETNEMIWEGQRVACTFSVAVLPIGVESAKRSEVLGAAEALLAEAKNRGGNCVVQREPGQVTKIRRRDDKTWLDWLLPRLDNGQAHLISQELHSLAKPPAQPMIEVFLRVEDDDGVWLEPGYFLPAITRMRKTVQVDLWVLGKLIATLQERPELLESNELISVNFSSQSLLDPEFAAAAFEILAASPVPTRSLCLEIDEAFAISHSSVVQRFLEQLRPLGVRIALDRCHTTFGLTQLRHLPIDYMKIDPSITRNVELDALDRAHLRWICDAAHLLGRKTAAINIEAEGSLALLQGAGVDYVQGTAINKFGPLMT